ncbi:MAG TPA: glutathione S-transferase family protein [Kofleriaceae bacterium]
MIDFYGAPASSAGRTHLLLEEIGVPFTYHRVNLREPAAKADFKRINPTGRVPFIVDGDVRLAESMAINFYLADKYAPQLWASDPVERARIYEWSLWGIANLQDEGMRFARHGMLVPAEHRSSYEVESGKANTQKLLDELETVMPASGFLVGDRFTVADINVASVVNLAAAFGAGTLGPKTKAWLDGLKARPAWQKVAKGG